MFDRVTSQIKNKIFRAVYFGPNRGSAEWQAKGAFAWGCDAGDKTHPCSAGGFCPTLMDAAWAAGHHANTHRNTRAVGALPAGDMSATDAAMRHERAER